MRTLLHRLLPAVSVALFGFALWVLHRELAGGHWHEIGASLAGLTRLRLLLALVFTGLGYLALTAHDWLGFRHFDLRLSYPRVVLAAFIGFAFSNTLGQALLTGLPIRMRLYSAWKIGAEDAARVLAFCLLTFWLGVLTLCGLSFSFSHLVMPPTLHLPFASLRPLGWLCLAAAALYLLAGALRRAPIGWGFELPRPRTALTQMALGAVDLCLCAAVLCTLLPVQDRLPFPVFLTAYLVALLLGLLSLVPGGLGVFESAMVVLLGSVVPTPVLLGALLAFRAIWCGGFATCARSMAAGRCFIWCPTKTSIFMSISGSAWSSWAKQHGGRWRASSPGGPRSFFALKPRPDRKGEGDDEQKTESRRRIRKKARALRRLWPTISTR